MLREGKADAVGVMEGCHAEGSAWLHMHLWQPLHCLLPSCSLHLSQSGACILLSVNQRTCFNAL